MFTNWEKRFLKVRCIQYPTQEWAKTVQEIGKIWLWVHLCGGRLIQANWNYNVDREACAYISFYLVKLDPGTQFSLKRQPSTSHIVFDHRSRGISNSKQNSHQIAFYWSRDCNKDKTVCYTGTTQPKTSKIFNLLLINSVGRDPSNLQGVHMTDIPNVEEMLQLNIFLYDIYFVDGVLIGELARRGIQKVEKSIKLLRYNNHISYVNNINALFKAFRCNTCDTFCRKSGNLYRHLVTCSDRNKHIYPKNVYDLRKTLFEKLDAFNIPYRNEQKLFKNLAIFDFESIWVKEANSYIRTEITMWIGKHLPVSVYLVKPDPGTHFSQQRQSSSSHIVFYHRSRRIGNSKQSPDEIEFFWTRDCNQDKTVSYTGTTQPKTQPSRESRKCKRIT